jgi:hypothetical protein
VREDGAYVEAGENDNLIVQKLEANPDALGIFGFSFLDQNADKLQGSRSTASSRPSTPSPAATIRSRARCTSTSRRPTSAPSPASRSTCRVHQRQRLGPDGYLADKGLIPLPDDMRAEVAKSAQAMEPMSSPAWLSFRPPGAGCAMSAPAQGATARRQSRFPDKRQRTRRAAAGVLRLMYPRGRPLAFAPSRFRFLPFPSLLLIISSWPPWRWPIISGASGPSAVAGGAPRIKRLHSLPAYYGYYAALWVGLPGLLLLLFLGPGCRSTS